MHVLWPLASIARNVSGRSGGIRHGVRTPIAGGRPPHPRLRRAAGSSASTSDAARGSREASLALTFALDQFWAANQKVLLDVRGGGVGFGAAGVPSGGICVLSNAEFE